MQSEDAGTIIRFDTLIDFLKAKSDEHNCKFGNCSVQVRWTVTLEECCNARGRRFCRKLCLMGLHPFANVDLVQRSVGWVEGFSAPYFMCRLEGTFVGHTEQGGTAAHAVLLNQEKSSSMAWEASYVPAGKMVGDLKRFTQSRALKLHEKMDESAEDQDHYPGPLLWWDDQQGGMILEGLGLLVYFGTTMVQKPGEMVMTSCSRLMDDAGLFVQYHQTRTLAPNGGPQNPLVLFAQNLAPVGSASWCEDVLPRVACSKSASDSVMLCWGLGFLLFCQSHPEVSAAPSVLHAARVSLVRELLLPTLAHLTRLGPAFQKGTVLNKDLDKFVFPFDLYSRDVVSNARMEVFRQCVCDQCSVVIPCLLFAHNRTFRCLDCSGMKANGAVWEIEKLLKMLDQSVVGPCEMHLRPREELRELCGVKFVDSLFKWLECDAFAESQAILQAVFVVNAAGDVEARAPLERGSKVALSPVLTCDHVRLASVFLADSLPRLVEDGFSPPFVLLGYVLNFPSRTNGPPNCKFVIANGTAELHFDQPVAKGGKLNILY